MLSALLFILTILGLVILFVLLFIIIVVALVLFVPVRYRVEGGIDNSIKSLYTKIEITWLLSLLKVQAIYSESEFKTGFQIAWKKFEDKEDGEFQENNNVPSPSHLEVPSPLQEEETKVLQEEKSKGFQIEQPQVVQGEERTENRFIEQQKDDQELEPKKKLSDKVKAVKKKMEYTFSSICDKIKKIWKQIEEFKEFLLAEEQKLSLKKIKTHIFYLLKKIKPKKLKINAEFGLEDPSQTGMVLAGISVLYGFYGEAIQITPSFEEKKYIADWYMKGHLRLIHVLRIAWRVFRDKELMKSYRKLKKLLDK